MLSFHIYGKLSESHLRAIVFYLLNLVRYLSNPKLTLIHPKYSVSLELEHCAPQWGLGAFVYAFTSSWSVLPYSSLGGRLTRRFL